jgi:hypothetical protein
MEALKARVAELDEEISKVAEEIGGARGAQATRDGIQRRLTNVHGHVVKGLLAT